MCLNEKGGRNLNVLACRSINVRGFNRPAWGACFLSERCSIASTQFEQRRLPNSVNTSSLNRPSSPNRYPNDAVRFGDTAANVGVLALLEAFESTRSLPLPVKSAAGSVAAGLWRIGLTPIDAYKTTLQVLLVTVYNTTLKVLFVTGHGALRRRC